MEDKLKYYFTNREKRRERERGRKGKERKVILIWKLKMNHCARNCKRSFDGLSSSRTISSIGRGVISSVCFIFDVSEEYYSIVINICI